MTTVSQGLVDTVRRQTLPRKSAHIVDLITILWKNASKISEKKKRNLILLVLRQTKIWIGQLRNALDADLKIILSQNVPSHLKTVRKGASNRACDNSDDDNDLKVYASMARMSNDDKHEYIDYGDSSQLTNSILLTSFQDY